MSSPLPHSWVSGPSFDYASASYEDGYGAQKMKGVTHTRAILFVKPDVWDCDGFPASNGRGCPPVRGSVPSRLGQSRRGWKRKERRNVQSGCGNLGIYGLVPERTQLDVISGQEEPVVQGWIPRGKPYECQPLPTAVYRTEGGGTTAMSYVLAPIAPHEMSPVSYAERLTTSVGSTAGRVLLKDGRMIHFAVRLPDAGGPGTRRFPFRWGGVRNRRSRDGTVGDMMEVNGSGLKRNGTLLQRGEQLNGAG